MGIFESEVKSKKMAARCARYKKNGCRSKKCNLSTDHMTNSQWKKRNGEVMTYKMNVPMKWEEFKKLPRHIQKMYLEDLIERYSVNATKLSEMFGVHLTTFLMLCAHDEINIKFQRGAKMTKDQKMAFDKFAGIDIGLITTNACDDQIETDTTENTEEKRIVKEDDNIPNATMVESDKERMHMLDFELNFAGKFSREMLYNSLVLMIPEGAEVKIKVKCEIDC